MNDEPIGTKRTGSYGPTRNSYKTLWILVALAAVAVLLYFGFGRREVVRDAGLNRDAPGSYGRRPIDDRTVRPEPVRPVPVRPNDTLPPPTNDSIAPMPNDTTPVPPADDQPAPAPAPPSSF